MGELPLAEITDKCGFSSQAHFTRWFKQFVGTTPGEYFSISHNVAAASPLEDGKDSKTVDLTAERQGDVLSIIVSGQVNDTTSDLEKAVRNATRETDRAVILDFGETTLISNRGLQAILLIARELQSQNVMLVLCALSARDREKFRVTGLEMILPIHESRAQALASLSG